MKNIQLTDYVVVEVFKTNVSDEQLANRLITLLSERYPCAYVSFDLEDCDKVLRIKTKAAICLEELFALLGREQVHCSALE